MTIDVLDAGHDAFLELQLRCDADMAQDRAGELGEEALDEVKPGTMLGRKGELEAAGGQGGEPSSGLSGDVSGVIVEDQLDRRAGRISSFGVLEVLDEISDELSLCEECGE